MPSPENLLILPIPPIPGGVGSLGRMGRSLRGPLYCKPNLRKDVTIVANIGQPVRQIEIISLPEKMPGPAREPERKSPDRETEPEREPVPYWSGRH